MPCARVHNVHMDLQGQNNMNAVLFFWLLPNHFFPEQEPKSYWKRWQSKRCQRIQRIKLLRKIFWKRECLLWFAEHLFLNNSGHALQNLSECVLTVHGSVKALVHMQILLSLPSESLCRRVVFTNTHDNTHFLTDSSLCSTPMSLSHCLPSFSLSISHSCVEEGLGLRTKRLICAVSTTLQTIPTHTLTRQ